MQLQDALCDWSADTCHDSSRADCDRTTTSIYCRSDESAGACVKALSGAACGLAPDECKSINDTQRTLHDCQQIVAGICDIGARCNQLGGQSLDECQSEGEQKICLAAVGVLPTVNTCLDDLAAAACPGVGQAAQLPASCNGVVKQKTSSSSSSSPSSAEGPGGRWSAAVVGAAGPTVQ